MNKPMNKSTGHSRPKNSTNTTMTLGSGWNFLFGSTNSGKAVNERTAMQTSAVYACVRVLAEAIASLPLHVYQYTPDFTGRPSASKERVSDHPLYYLLHDEPNSEMTSFVFRETLMSHLLLWGNAYAQIIRDGRGHPLALYPLLPHKVTVSRLPNGELIYSYRLDYGEDIYKGKNASKGSGNTGVHHNNTDISKDNTIILRKDEILHIPGLGFDGLVGYSPIAMAKNAIGMALATEEYGAAFFANGAQPGGVLEHPGVIKDPQRVKDSWNAAYQGSGNANRVAVLEEGMKFQSIGIPPEQAQFLQTRKFQLNEIARIFRVPPHMVGDLEKSSFSNIEQQSLEFVKYTLDPWVVRWEQSLQQALILPNDKGKLFIKFNLDGLLRGDYQSRMKGYSTGIQNGFYSVNDVRQLENMNLIPEEEGGDLHLTNGNMMPLKARLPDYGK